MTASKGSWKYCIITISCSIRQHYDAVTTITMHSQMNPGKECNIACS